METAPCTICGEGGHHPRKCPSLSSPLELGFYKGQIPRGGGGDGEDDEHLQVVQGHPHLQVVQGHPHLGVRNNPMTISLHTKNLCITHQPVVMKKIESFRGLL
jgi:hypothetical protein